MPIRYIWRTVNFLVITLVSLGVLGVRGQEASASGIQAMQEQTKRRTFAPILPDMYACPNFVIIQELMHQIEEKTEHFTNTKHLTYLRTGLIQATQKYAADAGALSQRKAFILRTILPLIDPSHPMIYKTDYRCDGLPSSAEELTTVGWVNIKGKLHRGEPLTSDGTDCRDFPDKCAGAQLVYPIGILTSQDSSTFNSGAYISLGCWDKTSNAVYKLQRESFLYRGKEEIKAIAWEDSFNERYVTHTTTPNQIVNLVGYIPPHAPEGTDILPCESLISQVKNK